MGTLEGQISEDRTRNYNGNLLLMPPLRGFNCVQASELKTARGLPEFLISRSLPLNLLPNDSVNCWESIRKQDNAVSCWSKSYMIYTEAHCPRASTTPSAHTLLPANTKWEIVRESAMTPKLMALNLQLVSSAGQSYPYLKRRDSNLYAIVGWIPTHCQYYWKRPVIYFNRLKYH